MDINWPFVQTFVELISLIGAISVFGLVGTMKQTIASQKEYIGELKARSDDLRVENTQLRTENTGLERQFSVIHKRIDNVRDDHNTLVHRKLDEIKESLEA